jgi:hypothetical protein
MWQAFGNDNDDHPLRNSCQKYQWLVDSVITSVKHAGGVCGAT